MSDEELIARLRELASFERGVGVMQDFYCGDEMVAAADLITTLLAKIDALRAERDDWCEKWEQTAETSLERKNLLTAAEAKVEKLRGALREIEWSNNSEWQADRARAALKGDDHE